MDPNGWIHGIDVLDGVAVGFRSGFCNRSDFIGRESDDSRPGPFGKVDIQMSTAEDRTVHQRASTVIRGNPFTAAVRSSRSLCVYRLMTSAPARDNSPRIPSERSLRPRFEM